METQITEKVKVIVITDNFDRFVKTRPALFHEKFEPIHITKVEDVAIFPTTTKLILFERYDEALASLALHRYESFMRIV